MTVPNHRHNYVIKDFLVPIVSSIVSGAIASFATVIFLAGQSEGRFSTIENDISSLKVIMVAVQTNQIAIASNDGWRKSTDKRVDLMSNQINQMQTDRYTKEDGARDREASIKGDESILREINLRHRQDN